MRVILAVVAPFVAGALSFRRADKHMDGEDVWIPFSLKEGVVNYFNPRLGNVSAVVPAGGRSSEKVALLQSGVHEQLQEGCVPKCGWSCKNENCNQACKPKCNQPVCQTRCKRPNPNNCKVTCGSEQECAVVCPTDQPPVCKEGEQCTDPRCETQCSKPKGCKLVCDTPLDDQCHNECAPPKCEWECKRPEEGTCPKPECTMVCDPNPKCKPSHASYAIPKVPENHDVVAEFTAAGMGTWQTGPWSSCQAVAGPCGSGQQRRPVYCSADDGDCQGARPQDSQRCHKECTGASSAGGGDSFGDSGSFGLSSSGSSGANSFEPEQEKPKKGRRQHHRRPREEPQPEDDLASSSSGGSSYEDQEDYDTPPRGSRDGAKKEKEEMMWMVGGGALLILLVGAIVYIASRR
eukprot:CAMPEP_0204275034 /NCGR_PEP_ID=MMETSP0468-20130131/25523_1 /ASSEMBLY_ACC=CAM_ASM_000383 /TAXON_ID=2969 /ORGANISM="Oxyrrhis marina" /LENGTH=404 /DNA_ID=CAMNT_0051251315 /DNA_START=116 /DNA_END=1330 /DNA_ORIENTATION=-